MLTNNAGLPEVNPYTERARTDSVHRMHRQRLGQVKAKVDNSPPRRFPHIAANLKKQQMKNGALAVPQMSLSSLARLTHKCLHLSMSRGWSVASRCAGTLCFVRV